MSPDYISYGIGLIGIILAIVFRVKQHNAKKVMGVFVNSIQNQAQSVCRSLDSSLERQDCSLDWIRGMIQGANYNMAALNGTIIVFYKKFYERTHKDRS